MSIYDWKYKINDENEENRKMAELMIKASKFVESNYESNLQTNHATGSIFALKNMGWKDNQDHNHTGNIVVGYEYKNKDTQDFDQLED
jgi:DnaJ-class molecular chaperone